MRNVASAASAYPVPVAEPTGPSVPVAKPAAVPVAKPAAVPVAEPATNEEAQTLASVYKKRSKIKSRFAVKMIRNLMEPTDFNRLIAVATGDRRNTWSTSGEIVVSGGAKWLLEEDVEVAEILAHERRIYQYHLGLEADPSQFPTSLFRQALRQDPGLYALAVACTEDKNTQLLATPFQGEGCIVAEVTLEDERLGDVRFSREISESTRRRLIVEWVRVSKDGASTTGKGGSSRWARQAAAQASLSINGFPISGLLRPANFYRLPAALLAQCPWTDPGVCMEISMVLGADRELADRYITNVRGAILKELKGTYQKMEIVEEFTYGKDSCFCESESEAEAEPKPKPECGAKRRMDGEEATGSNRGLRARNRVRQKDEAGATGSNKGLGAGNRTDGAEATGSNKRARKA